MKHLILTLLLFFPFYSQAQYSYYSYPDTKVIYVAQPSVEYLPIYTDNWYYQDSRSIFYSGVALTGMTGLSLYYNTLGEGPYIPFAVVFGTAAVGKFIHAGILRKKEKNEFN